ncbi:MAG: hypothetical protein ACE5HP_13225 [Gemmatimonadota bacterium]
MSPLSLPVIGAIVQVPTMLPVDLTAIVAIVMGVLVVLIPVAGITARFALKPIADAVARFRETQSAARQLELVEQRLALLEQQLGNVETEVQRLDEAVEFERQLAAGKEG